MLAVLQKNTILPGIRGAQMFYQYLLLSTPVMMGIVLTIYVKKMLRDEEKKRVTNIEKDVND